MGQLTRIEVSNFKSYKSKQTIDFGQSFFTSIIGPNGAGKSNMMDAISFVLGIKSSHLRSTQLRDLVYRGRVMTTNNNYSTQAEGDPDTASVIAVYVKDDGEEMQLKRSITSQGSSEYRLNGTVVSASQYARALEEENILIKARNFLVFQGDVEAIAAQSPKDLTRLIEQISGSLEHKSEYENLKDQQERAAEASTIAFNKKRTYNVEIKQYVEQKNEVELFEKKMKQKDSFVITHILWQLYHYTRSIEASNAQIEASQEKARELRSELANEQAALDDLKAEHSQALRKLQKQERSIRKLEKQIEEKDTSMVPVDEKIKVINANEQRHKTRQSEVAAEYARQEAAVKHLQTELEKVEKTIAEFEAQQLTASQSLGISLSEADIQTYASLKETFNRQAAKEKAALENLLRQKRTNEDSGTSLRVKIDEFKTQKSRLEDEISEITVKNTQISARVNQDIQDLESKKQQLNSIVSERMEQTAKQEELNKRLQICLNELIEVNADRRESEREMRMRDKIESLKRIVPGVRGRVCDLCKPKQRKYETAMSTVLGRNFDAIVVDTQKTATDCIAYMREQRAGVCTFIPLDSVVVKPISNSLKGMHKQMRLAIDTIDYDPSNQRAMEYVCGSAVVCDDMNVAKFVRWEKGIDAKAVTLDGSVIHKGGLMTGGRNGNATAKKWEDQAVKGLQMLKENLMAELAELAKARRNPSIEETLSGDVSGLEQRLTFERDELAVIHRTLKSKEDELKFINDQLSVLVPKLTRADQEIAQISSQASELENAVQEIEGRIYASFCEKIGVQSIRQYEEFQGALLQEAKRKRLIFTTQRSRLANQLKFEQERLAETSGRLNNINASIEKEVRLVNQLIAEKTAITEEIDLIKSELPRIKEAYGKLKESADVKAEEASKVRSEVQNISKEIEKISKRINAVQEEMESKNSQRANILRNCKLEGIDIPLSAGSLNSIPIGESALTDTHMDIDDSGTMSQAPPAANDYGIVVNFSSLSKSLREDGSDEAGETLLENIRSLAADMEKMSPNVKALERLEEIEGRLAETEAEFVKARKDAKEAKDRFNAVKEKRLDLFNRAYTHISEQIDKIYKELTKSRSFPLGGTAYLTVEDQDEPYLDGIKYHAMPPMKRFRDMDQLSGGEKTMAALALLFAIHSYRPSPFFVLDEVDAALDNANVAKIANYIHDHAGPGFQFIVISLKNALFERSDALVGIYRAQVENSSRALTLDLRDYPE
ncbi:putative cohesin complex subunit [Myxozyma melibiosi]|uniref:Structural maintenance of chromosomes protein n=1 Tax=Myxozyma melibiosi TaxID=54550 RepID=A0ABR1FBI4_9ASCO